MELASSTHFVYDFSRKMFLILYSINWEIFVAWLTLLLEILGNICIVIIYCLVCDVIDLEIKHSFLIKLLFYLNKKSEHKCKYLKNEKSFSKWNKKHFLSFVKGFHFKVKENIYFWWWKSNFNGSQFMKNAFYII